MKINGKEIKAVIFDLDGTLLESTNVWTNVDKHFFNSRGMEIPPTYVDDIAHIGLKEAAAYTKRTYNIKESEEEIMKEWREGTLHQYMYEVKLKPNALLLLEKLKKENIRLAIATANDRCLYEPCLKRNQIYDFFEIIADVNEVHAGKNSVKLYDYFAKKLNIDRENIAIFEDISVGLKTAYENGFVSVAVYDDHSSKEDDIKRKYSHLFIYNFDELL